MANAQYDDLPPDFPRYWNPDELPELVGEVIEFDRGPSQYQPDGVPIIVVRQDDGEAVSVWITRSVLRFEVRDAAPEIGDRLRFRYLGPRYDDQDQLRYRRYRVTNLTKNRTLDLDDDAPDEGPF